MGNSEREWAKSYDRNSTKRKVEAVPGIHRAVRAKAASDLAEADVELRRFHPSAARGPRPPPPPPQAAPAAPRPSLPAPRGQREEEELPSLEDVFNHYSLDELAGPR